MTKEDCFYSGRFERNWTFNSQKFASNRWNVAGFYSQKEGPKIKNVSWHQLEISSYSGIKNSFEKAFNDFGRIDCFLNCIEIFVHKSIYKN